MCDIKLKAGCEQILNASQNLSHSDCRNSSKILVRIPFDKMVNAPVVEQLRPQEFEKDRKNFQHVFSYLY